MRATRAVRSIIRFSPTFRRPWTRAVSAANSTPLSSTARSLVHQSLWSWARLFSATSASHSATSSHARSRLRSVGVALVLAVGFAPPFAHAQLPDSTKRDTTVHSHRRPVRRQPVTPELERSAFADAQARTLLARARAARMSQDSALRSYDAKSYFRLSVGMGVRSLGNKLLLKIGRASCRERV